MLKKGQYASVRSGSGTWYGQVDTAPTRWGGPYLIRMGGTDEVVKVPWNQVGLHSAFATRSVALSKASNAKIDAVLAKPDLLRIDTCTGAMQGILDLLGTGSDTEKKSFDPKKDADGLYRLVLNFGADINTKDHDGFGWEHGMVFQKIGGEVVYYQAWVSEFSLEDWLLLKPRALCLQSAKYAPRHPSFHPGLMEEFFTYLYGLRDEWNKIVKYEMNGQLFSPFAARLFGPDSEVMQLEIARKRGSELQYHWRYTPFKK